MLVLLPPSEGKTAVGSGPVLDLATLVDPSLTDARRTVLDTLVDVSARPDAHSVLGVGPRLSPEVDRNVRLMDEPCGPARAVYTGVLFGAAGLGALPPPGRALAARAVRIVSALWGLVGPEDLIPAYRLSMGTALPGLGALGRFWSPRLAPLLDPWGSRSLVVDCRSAAYAAAWGPATRGPGHVAVRVLREVEGRRTVVSHWAKHTRGALVHHLLTRAGAEPTTPVELRDAALEMVGSGPIGATGPGLMTSELRAAELGAGPRGTTTLSLVVA